MKKRGMLVFAVVVLGLALMAGAVAAASPAGATLQAALAPTTPTPGTTSPQAAPKATATPQAYMGVTVANIDQSLQTKFNLSQTSGVVVANVAANSPAATAGLKAGDVIIAVNGTAVNTAQDVVTAVRALQPGAQITLSISRAGATQTITATAGTAPARAQGQFGMSGRGFTLPPELNGLLQGVNPSDLFSHNLGSTRTLKDKDGNTVTIYTIPGVVKEISATSITITPNNPQSKGGPYSIDSTTRILTGKSASGTDAIAVNDQVTVVTTGTSNHASVISKGGAMGLGGGMLGGDFGNHFGGRGFMRGPNGNQKVAPNTTPTTPPGAFFRRFAPQQQNPAPVVY